MGNSIKACQINPHYVNEIKGFAKMFIQLVGYQQCVQNNVYIFVLILSKH